MPRWEIEDMFIEWPVWKKEAASQVFGVSFDTKKITPEEFLEDVISKEGRSDP